MSTTARACRPAHRSVLVLALLCLGAMSTAQAFCGFYVGKVDAGLFNEASQVIIARRGSHTVISMGSDYRGELSEFALVVPVPQVLQKSQIHIGDRAIFDRLDAYSAPRLVEYHDPDPCTVARQRSDLAAAAPKAAMESRRERALGVTVEARYQVGEYDIAILSARESDGLETWLVRNGYRLPAGASAALLPYIRQDMKFFVAKVNLAEQAKTGSATLRPLQFAFDSDRFMLPVRLGMLNAHGVQDLVIYVLTAGGRVETTNYRTARIPANVDLPVFVRDEFPATYKALFARRARMDGHRAVYTEYFWDMAWCDPCAADPLTPDELRQAGVFWLPGTTAAGRNAAQPVLLTRLHLAYTRESLPEDLVFQETSDRQNFQARYVLRHPWTGAADACAAAPAYFQAVAEREQREVETLASLTGRDLAAVRARVPQRAAPARWWETLWP